MFSIEMDHDEIIITVIHENAIYEDLRVYIYDDLVYIKQWNEDLDRFETIQLSPDMFEEFFKAFDQPEGLYQIRR